MNQIAEAVGLLSAVKEQLKTILTDPEHEHHALKIQSDLQRQLEYLNLITGAGIVTSPTMTKLAEATTIAGQPIKFVGKKQVFDVTPEEVAVQSLKDKANRAYAGFLNEDSKTIRKEYDDTVIRAVAKKAGMKHVTMDEPEVIDMAFIDTVKAEIVKSEQFKMEQSEAAKVKPGQPVLDRNTEEVDGESAFDDEIKGSDNGLDVGEIEQLKDEQAAVAVKHGKVEMTKQGLSVKFNNDSKPSAKKK
jgi:hypothetical protein